MDDKLTSLINGDEEAKEEAEKPEENEEENTDIEESSNKLNNNTEPNDPSIIDTDISEEMQKSYLDYAMSVIVSRALPDVRDGLELSTQCRIKQ